MECVGWLILGLIVAAAWMASRRTRFEVLEEAVKAQENRNAELALRLDRMTRELDLLRQSVSGTAPEAPPPLPRVVAAPPPAPLTPVPHTR